MNIIDTITLAGTLVLALPIGMLGVEFLLTGRPVAGVGFVAVAAALVLGQHYLEPDIKSRIAGGIVDRIVPDADDPGEGGATGDTGAASTGSQSATDDQSADTQSTAGSSSASGDAQSAPVDIPSATADAQSASADAQSTADDEEGQRS